MYRHGILIVITDFVDYSILSHYSGAHQRSQPKRRGHVENPAGPLCQEPPEERALPAGQREGSVGVQAGLLASRVPQQPTP